MEKKLFEKYYSRLKAEGFIKALLCGAIAGFAAMFAVAFATWFVYNIKFWVSIVTGGVVWAAATAIFYYKKFRPTTLAIAKRVDALGLEERLITMTELENDDSYIAMRQREDAQEKLKEVESSRVKIKVRAATAVAAGVVMALGVSMTTVKGLADSGALPSGGAAIGELKPQPDPVTHTVSYIVEEGGYIDGEADQVVEEGGKTEIVVAIAEEGWQFAGWMDSRYPDAEELDTNPTRIDANVIEDREITAVFQRVEEGDGESGGDGEEGDGDEGEPSDEPQEGKDSQQNGGGDQDGDGNGGGAGGEATDNNKILDGETDYGELLPGSRAEAEALLASGNLTPRQRAYIEKYYGIINK